MATPALQVLLPDLLKYCPSKPATNRHYEAVRQASELWIQAIVPEERQARFASSKHELLTSYSYPYAGYDQLRLCSDMVNLAVVIDDLTDRQTKEDARATCEMALAIFAGASRGDGSTNLFKHIIDIVDRYEQFALPTSFKRFTLHMQDFLKRVIGQAELREQQKVLDTKAYIAQRGDNSATKPFFDLVELCLGIDLPDEVYDIPAFMDAYTAVVDMVWLENDIYSYRKEKATGHRHYNIITIFMKEFNMNIQSAFDHAGSEFHKLWVRFEAARNLIPSLGPMIDADIQKFLDGIIQWLHGATYWSFETPRYFGEDKEHVKATHSVVV